MKSFVSILILASTIGTSANVFPEHRHSHLHHQKRTSISASISLKPGFICTFFDDFIGIPDTLPSSANWIFDLGTSYPGGPEKWGNNENETYTADPANVHITSAQTMAITPLLTPTGWTSARLETQRSDFSCAKGGKLYIESRIKLGSAPAINQQGIWPAFWALGTSFRGNYTNWPLPSEWDFLEVISGQDVMFSTLHCGVAPGGPCNEFNGLGSGGVPFTRGEWHTVGFLVDRTACGWGKNGTWKDESISWFLDGRKIFTIKGKTVGDEETWRHIAHDDHFLLFNVAVGGNWPGFPNELTIDGPSVGMEVDYVGVWNSL